MTRQMNRRIMLFIIYALMMEMSTWLLLTSRHYPPVIYRHTRARGFGCGGIVWCALVLGSEVQRPLLLVAAVVFGVC